MVTGPGSTSPPGDRVAVQAADRQHRAAGARQKRFFGGVDVIGREVVLDRLDAEPGCDLQDGRPGDAAERVARPRRAQPATSDEEKVRRARFGDVAVDVEDQRQCLGVGLLGLEAGLKLVHPVGELGFGIGALRRSAADARRDQLEPVEIGVRETTEPDVQTIHHDRGRGVVPLQPVAPADHLPQREVAVGRAAGEVPRNRLARDRAHLLDRQARSDPGVGERAEQPRHVELQPEQRTVIGPRDLIDAVAAGKAPVEHRDPGPACRHEVAVEIDHPFGHRPLPSRAVAGPRQRSPIGRRRASPSRPGVRALRCRSGLRARSASPSAGRIPACRPHAPGCAKHRSGCGSRRRSPPSGASAPPGRSAAPKARARPRPPHARRFRPWCGRSAR